MTTEQEVLKAAAHIVAAFGSHSREEYFDCFALEATFMFHNAPRLLASRLEYETEWAAWETEGFRVLSCTSHDGHVTLIGDNVAVFTHTVRTTLAGSPDDITTGERETIVFVLRDGRWLGVHEHLSIDPNFS
jgi:hypothetical protein